MPSAPNRLLWWTAIVLLGFALLVVTAVSYAAVAQPGCESCHLKQDFKADTAAAPHSSVTCVSCHVGPSLTGRVSFATRQVFHMVIPVVPTVDRSYADVPAERCASCHDAVENAGPMGSKGLVILHSKCAAGQSCTECHSLTAHGASTRWPRTAQMEDCYECHGQTNKKTACDTCHSERSERQLVFDGPFRVTHGPEWQSTHGMGDTRSCIACHDEEKCGKCHGVGVPHEGNFLSKHADLSTDPKSKCTTCHTKQFCADCHAYPMPHSIKFTLEHGKTVKKDGERKCLTCHEKDDCTQCHVDHVHPVTREQIDSFPLRRPGASGGER